MKFNRILLKHRLLSFSFCGTKINSKTQKDTTYFDAILSNRVRIYKNPAPYSLCFKSYSMV